MGTHSKLKKVEDMGLTVPLNANMESCIASHIIALLHMTISPEIGAFLSSGCTIKLSEINTGLLLYIIIRRHLWGAELHS